MRRWNRKSLEPAIALCYELIRDSAAKLPHAHYLLPTDALPTNALLTLDCL